MTCNRENSCTTFVIGENSCTNGHDFCNWRIRENKSEIPMIAHNLFDVKIFFFLKGYRATTCCTKDIKCGGSNLTHINFANIIGEVKFIDTLKHYQKGLAELSTTLSDEEKNSVKQLTTQFLSYHHYFQEV